MRDLLSWNLPLGRWAGVQVRLHVFFIIFAVFVLQFCAMHQKDLLWYGVAVVGLLFVSVLAHELGHCLAAAKVGGQPEIILLWPFGGLAQICVSRDPGSERVIAVAGPLVNAAICTILAPILFVTRASPEGLFNPIMPPMGEENYWLEGLRLAFWLNWVLVVVNLLPAYPLDGGRILRSMLWPSFGYATSGVYVARAAKIAAVGIWILAWWCAVHKHDPMHDYQYAMGPLVLLGVFLFFSGRQEPERGRERHVEDDTAGYDFSQGYSSLEQSEPTREATPGPVRQWLEKRRAARLQKQIELAEEEERKADEVLARLHESGLHSLSDEDRALLDRVSARLRSRLRR